MQSLKSYSQASWVNFVRSLNNQATKEAYTNDVVKYMEYLKLENPDGLLTGTTTELENNIIQFIEKRNSDKVSSFSIRRECASIKKFYDRNRIALSWPFILDTIGKTRRKQVDEAYTREQIHKLWDIADAREKAVITLLSSTGIRSGAIPTLAYGDLKPIDNYGIYKIIVYAGYSEQYYTFCTPECRKALEGYFTYRKKAGELIIKSSPVLRDMFDHKLKKRVENPIAWAESSIYGAIDNLAQKVGLRVKKKGTEGKGTRHEFKLLHGFRKFFDTQCTTAGINPLWVEILEGHDIKLKASYFRPSENDLLEGNDRAPGYVEAINSLTINDEFRLKQKVSQLEQAKTEADKRLQLVEHHELVIYDMQETIKRLEEKLSKTP